MDRLRILQLCKLAHSKPGLMPWVVMQSKYLRSSCCSGMEYHWPSDYPRCSAPLGRNYPYIGCGLCTNKLEHLEEIGQETTFGGIKEGSPFPANGTFGHLGARIGPQLGFKPQWTCYQHYQRSYIWLRV